MTLADFQNSLTSNEQPAHLSAPLLALWWDAKGDWQQAHALIDDLESKPAMAVHAYLHHKEGDRGNAAYWDRRAGSTSRHATLEAEWTTLVQHLLSSSQP